MSYENVIKANKARATHGLHNTSIYRRWQSIVQRCYNPANNRYKRYGGRGITVCDRWRYSFENFYADMGHPPEGKTLDRIDNSKGYEPSNCKWSTPQEQSNNCGRNVFIEHDGMRMTIAEWARYYKIPYHWVRARNKSGINPPELFSTKNHKGETVKIMVEYQGKQVTLKELSTVTNIKLQTLYYRFNTNKPLLTTRRTK